MYIAYIRAGSSSTASGGRRGGKGVRGSQSRKGACKERLLLQLISVTTQVAVSREVQRFMLAL